ncbi:MAG: AraC family transcriptional regulator [Gammaproteobacteria bacterium]|nr:AraC family transcriptional regulator [Gammaproteobacteria bacterium]
MPAWARFPNLPVTYARAFIQVAEECGVSAAQVMAYAHLQADRLADPAARLSLYEALCIIEAVLALTGRPGLGFDVGNRMPLTAHGYLGYALMCAPTVREAISVLQRYWHLRGRGVHFQFLEQGTTAVFDFSPEASVPLHLRQNFFNSMLVSVFRGMQFLLGGRTVGAEIWFDVAEPDYFAEYREHLPPIRYGMPAVQIRLPNVQLYNDVLPTANPEAFSLAVAQCEQESALYWRDVDDIVQRVRHALHLGDQGYPTPASLAEHLNMTPRTLRRRLQEQGSSYRRLVEEARRRDSGRLLLSTDLEIYRVSECLGYADPANFTRAFRAWTGQTPHAWRASRRIDESPVPQAPIATDPAHVIP